MAGLLDTYNADVMAIPCPKCGVGSLKRCRGRGPYAVTAAHAARLAAAGYRWDHEGKRLERLNNG